MPSQQVPHLRLKLDALYEKHAHIKNNVSLANHLAIFPSNISQWRRGMREDLVPDTRVPELANAFGISLDVLLEADLSSFYDALNDTFGASLPVATHEIEPDYRDKISSGLDRLIDLLRVQAPVLLPKVQHQIQALQTSLHCPWDALSHENQREFLYALSEIDRYCLDALDMHFEALARGHTPPEAQLNCPFPGLYGFTMNDQHAFFGREELVEELTQRLLDTRLLMLMGASGCGKSSLAIAGILPALQCKYAKHNTQTLSYRIMRPGETPLARLFNELDDSQEAPQLLIIDQFEEVFSLCTDNSERDHFITELMQLIKAPKHQAKISIILTMRVDFWSQCADYSEFAMLMESHHKLISPLGLDALRNVVSKQAEIAKLRFEPHLLSLMFDELAEHVNAMSLVQHVLHALWNRRHGRNLKIAEYQALGGVKRAIQKTADDFYESLNETEKDLMQQVFIRLMRVNSPIRALYKDVRGRAHINELTPKDVPQSTIQRLLERLVAKRLLIYYYPEGSTARSSAIEIQVSHETLIHHWPRLQYWLEKERNQLRIQHRLTEAAYQWLEKSKDKSILYNGAQLAEAQEWGQHHRQRLNVLEDEFLLASESEENSNHQAELARQEQALQFAQLMNRKILRRSRMLMIAGGVLSIMLLVIGVMYQDSRQAKQNANLARNQAEDLVQFMVNDLHHKLEFVGRLDILETVNHKILQYNQNATQASLLDQLDINRFAAKVQTLIQTADIQQRQSQNQSALNTLKLAQKMSQNWLKAQRDNQEGLIQQRLFMIEFKKGHIYWLEEKLGDALEAFQAQRQIAHNQLQENPNDILWQQDLSNAMNNIAALLQKLGNHQSALAEIEKVVSIKEGLKEHDPDNADYKMQLATSLKWRAELLAEQGDYQTALDDFKHSQQFYQALSSANPENRELLYDAALIATATANTYHLNQQPMLAQAQISESIKIFRQLTTEEAYDFHWRRGFAQAQLTAGRIYLAQQQQEQAKHYFTQALAIVQQLIQGEHNKPAVSRIAGEIYAGLAQIELDSAPLLKPHQDDARHHIETALNHLNGLISPNARYQYSYVLYLRAMYNQRHKNHQLAAQDLEEVRTILKGLLVSVKNPRYYKLLEKVDNNLEKQNVFLGST